MEEEYRMQKAQVDINAVEKEGVNGSVRDSGVGTFSSEQTAMADDDASTRAMASPGIKHDKSSSQLEVGPAVPTIRVSTESDRARDEDVQPNGDGAKANGADTAAADAEGALGKPMQAAAPAEEGEEVTGETATLNGGEAFSFSNKRLCERWLDNLFMVLYEVRYFLYSVHDCR